MNIKMPYEHGYDEISISKSRLAAVIKPEQIAETYVSQEEIIMDALRSPIDSPGIKSIVEGAKNVLIITSDHTRPVPSKITMPILLNEIRTSNPDINIKILIATGCHRPSTKDELIAKFGQEIADNEDIVMHISHDKDSMVFKGILPSGGELWLNSLVDWADEIIAEGFIEPHFFAGFSGGRKSILPGIAYDKTVMYNHNSSFISDTNARTGILDENPIHKDMVFAAQKAGLSFILNVILNEDKKVIKAYSGHFLSAHKQGCDYLKKNMSAKAVISPIAVTSNGGYPLDQNIYQAVKGMTAAEACITPGGIIIMFASCVDGHGGTSFYDWFKSSNSANEVTEKINSISPEHTIADQWEAQILARIQQKCKAVIIVSRHVDPSIVEDMHMHCAKDFNSALALADSLLETESKITVIPDGVGVIIEE